MKEVVVLDSNYSTTHRVIKADSQEMAQVVKQSNKPEDKFETLLFLPEGEGRQGEGGLRTRRCFKQTSEGTPLITVVTVVYNGEQFLEETILSVINQTYDNVEYIIIDGGSTDGTLAIIRRYEHAIDYWVSERDKGIYDAMNKGISLATGDWINFMNAGDKFVFINTLDEANFSRLSNYALVYGNKIQDKKIIYPLPIESLEVGEIMACHQSMFFNIKPSFKSNMFYDLKYKIYGDYELVNRLYKKYKNLKYINQEIAVFQGCGISSIISSQKRKDKYRVLWLEYGLFGLYKGFINRLLR